MRPAIVAIPAKDEAERIGPCLAALATQRDHVGAPLEAGAFTILVFANNCQDGTADAARTWGALGPHPVLVVAEAAPAGGASAGWARKRAMDLAAQHLDALDASDGVILTTDADSIVGSTWVDATMRAFATGVDAVAGTIDAVPAEIMILGPAFLRRGRLEDHYLRAIAEIDALCDPRPHNPWPTHRVSSGASLAVTVTAYRAIGGLPPLPVGEDIALTRALDAAGFAVRHAMDVVVATSCRLDGRATGGAADTMRHRHTDPDAPCDADLDRADALVLRAIHKGRLRQAHLRGLPFGDPWATRLGLGSDAAAMMRDRLPREPFARCWEALAAESPVLRRCSTMMRPSDLPREIARAEALLVRLRRLAQPRTSRSSR